MISECDERVSPIDISWFQTDNYLLSTKKKSTVLEYNQQISRVVTLLGCNLSSDFEVQKVEIFFDTDLKDKISLRLNNFSFDATSVDGNKLTFDFRADAFETFRIVTSSTIGLKLNKIDSVLMRLPENHQITQTTAPVRFYTDETSFIERLCYFKGFFHPEIYHPIQMMTLKGTLPFGIIIFINDKEHYRGNSRGSENLLKLKFDMGEIDSALMIDKSIKHPSNLQKHFLNTTNNYFYIVINSETEQNSITLDCDCLEIKNIHLF